MYACQVILTVVLLLHFPCFTASSSSHYPPPRAEYIFANPPHTSSSSHAFRIPTIHESAILARRMLNLSSIATLSTVFSQPPPSSQKLSLSHLFSNQQQPQPQSQTYQQDVKQQQQPLSHYTPDDLSVSGAPIGLMDYYASCSPHPSDPIILALSIATTFRNARAGSNISLSLRWIPPSPPSSPSTADNSVASPSPVDKHHDDQDDDDDDNNDPWLYIPANLPRFNLLGYIEPIPESEVSQHAIDECFFARHPEARTWAPGNNIHESWWARLKVQGVYWIGGFGDRAYIGWIPEGVWSGVTDEEVERARLVGE